MKPLPILSLIGISALAAVLGASPAHAADFVNGGFETGSFDGWTQNGGYWYGGTNYPDPAEYVFTNAPYQSAIVPLSDVPCLTSRTVSVSQFCSGLFAARP